MILDKNLSDAEKVKKLGTEMARLENERKAFEGTWREAQELVSSVTLAFDIHEGGSVEGFNTPKRITNRPAQYQETLIAGLCGYGVSPNITWMKLGLSDDKSSKGYGVKDWLEDVERAEYEEFDNSNFYTEQKIAIEQASTFGFGIMLVDEDKVNGSVVYRHIDVPEVYLDTNEHGEYETVFRKFFMTVENLVSRFSLNKMHESIRDRWHAENSDAEKSREIEVVHAVFRRKNRKGVSERNTEMPFASFYVDRGNNHVIEEGGYQTFPYSIFAWDRVGGKKYPISPAIKAVNDVKLLNKTEDTRLTLAQMAAKTPVALPDSMKNASEIFGKDKYIRPGAIFYYDKHGANEQVPAGINLGNNYPITLEITNQMANNIKDWFYVDFFLMLQQQNINGMTATAVHALEAEKATVMTNMITNLKKALQTSVQRTYDIMAKQGRLPDLPTALLRPSGEKGNKMRFTFSSVLSQIQQRLVSYNGTQQFLPVAQAVANLGQAYPPAAESLDRFDFDILLQNEARASHVPETAIREDEDVEAIRSQRARALAARQQAEQQQQAQQTLAQNYNKLNEPPKPGSPAASMFGGAQ
jgi:hypothetical protein